MNIARSISVFDRNTVRHLRFPFSFYLMPVFLFALSQAEEINWPTAILGFIILHLLIFPSANGYNSFQDRDETSIGGLEYPPKVTIHLFFATLILDLVAIVLSFLISVNFTMLILLFVIMSRIYSYRKIRLKKHPYLAFLIVFIFQGGTVYLASLMSFTPVAPFNFFFSGRNVICMIISSLFIGGIYPLTQIYQHQADKKDGVISISYKLGYRGTFIFSSVLFILAGTIMFFYFNSNQNIAAVLLFLVIMIPVVIKMTLWFRKVHRDTTKADYSNTMSMNFLTSFCMNLFFSILIIIKLFNLF